MGQQECLANHLPYILLEQTTAKLGTVNYKKAKELILFNCSIAAMQTKGIMLHIF